MPASFTNNGDGTITITFEYTADQDKMDNVANDAAESLFDNGWFTQPDPGNLITFDQLTNTQKLAMLDAFVRRELVRLARNKYLESSIDTARITAITDAETRYF